MIRHKTLTVLMLPKLSSDTTDADALALRPSRMYALLVRLNRWKLPSRGGRQASTSPAQQTLSDDCHCKALDCESVSWWCG